MGLSAPWDDSLENIFLRPVKLSTVFIHSFFQKVAIVMFENWQGFNPMVIGDHWYD